MSNADLLEVYRRERGDLLERATRLLEADERIVAAWLHGSMGRDAHDDWSDIDLWIVVADEHMKAVGFEREAFLRELGPLLLTVEAEQNAPPDGAYLFGMYPGAQGPQVLDCSWERQSRARRRLDTQLLFDRAGIPTIEATTATPGDNSLELAKQKTAFFWMMSTILGKYIARHSWEVTNMLSFVWSVAAHIEWLVGERAAAPVYRDAPPFPVPVGPQEQLAALRGLIADMEALVARIPALSDAASSDTVQQVHLYLDTVERALSS